jgi:hypothetical protein
MANKPQPDVFSFFRPIVQREVELIGLLPLIKLVGLPESDRHKVEYWLSGRPKRNPKPGEEPNSQRALSEDVANRLIAWFMFNRFDLCAEYLQGIGDDRLQQICEAILPEEDFDKLMKRRDRKREMKRLRERLAALEQEQAQEQE